MSNDFEWNGKDADAVRLQHQPRTAVYSTATGNVVVRQEADAMQEHDDMIYLTPQGALTIAYALIEEAHLVGIPQPSLSLMTEDMPGPDREAPSAQRPGRGVDHPEPPEPGPLLAAMEAANDTASAPAKSGGAQ